MANASDNQLDADARHRLCLAIDEELAAFLCCVDTYETASREVWDRPHRAKLSPRPASDTAAARAADCRGVQVGNLRHFAGAQVHGVQVHFLRSPRPPSCIILFSCFSTSLL